MDRINATGAVLNAAGKRVFVDQDLVAGIAGTDVVAAWLTGMQEEGMALVEASGQAPDPANLTQLRTAVQRASTNIVTDTGAANAMVVAPSPAVTALTDLLSFRVRPAASSTGAATVALAGQPVAPLTYPDGRPLFAGELVAGRPVIISYDAVNARWLLTSPASQLGAVFLKAQSILTDVVQDANAPNDYQSAPSGTILGQLTLPSGLLSARIDATCFVSGASITNPTNIYMAIFFRVTGAAAWTLMESQATSLPVGALCALSRNAAISALDPTVSHDFIAHLMKNAMTGAPCPPSGNLLVQGFRQ